MFGAQTTDVSYGRFANGTGNFQTMTPTFGAININSTSLSELSISNSDISIYPNPAESYFTIELKNVDSIERELVVYNTSGKLVYSSTMNKEVTLDVQNWTAGLYFIRIGTTTSKLIVR